MEIAATRIRSWPRWADARRAASATLAALLVVLLSPVLRAPFARADEARADEAAVARKTLRVATSGDYAPFSFAPLSNAAPASGDAAAAFDGFDIEIATRFARERGYRLEFVRFRWPDLGRELAAANFDVAMSGVTMRPERSIAGRYSVPVAASHAVAITWKGSGVTLLPELDRPGRRIAVNAGGHLESVARHVFHRAEVVPLADNDAVRMAMLDRTFDAVLTDSFEEKVWTASARDIVRIGPLSDDRKAYLLPPDRAALAAELDRWLLAREKDGTLAQLRERYLAGSGGVGAATGAAAMPADTTATAEPVAALGSAIAERLALMPMVYETKRRDGKPIEDKEQEAAVLDGAVRAVAVASHDSAASDSSVPVPAGAALDTEAIRFLFETLIVLGKDVQQRLADIDAKQRPGLVRHHGDAGNASDAGNAAVSTPGADADAANAGGPKNVAHGVADSAVLPARSSAEEHANEVARSPAPDPADGGPGAAPTHLAPVSRPEPYDPASRKKVYDLATELRPAIGRITDKIARILVAMHEEISVAEARRRLAVSLADQGVRDEVLDALASAVARLSARRPAE